jgi:hypothetical protein
LRIETLKAIYALAEEHRLLAPEDVSMQEFTAPSFTSLTIQLPHGNGGRDGVSDWARVLGLPEPKLQRFGDASRWHEAFRSTVNKPEPAWLGWNLVEVTCTVARGGAS